MLLSESARLDQLVELVRPQHTPRASPQQRFSAFSITSCSASQHEHLAPDLATTAGFALRITHYRSRVITPRCTSCSWSTQPRRAAAARSSRTEGLFKCRARRACVQTTPQAEVGWLGRRRSRACALARGARAAARRSQKPSPSPGSWSGDLVQSQWCDGAIKPATLNRLRVQLKSRYQLVCRSADVMCRTLDATDCLNCVCYLEPVAPD
jgi:hypothetical protein